MVFRINRNISNVVNNSDIKQISIYQIMDEEQLMNTEMIEIINTVSFNWDNTCIALATNKGFKIYATQPLKLKQYRDLGAPLQFVEMVDRTNLLAFVGFQNSAFVAHRVAIFDDNSNNIIADLSFESNIMAVKIRLKKMMVALANKIYQIDFLSLEVEHIIPTYKFAEEEPYNLISMSNNPENFLMACPTIDVGYIILVFIETEKQRRIRAHQSILSSVVLTLNGEKVATCSEKGINIRIFNTITGEMLQEVRRGNQFGMIYSMSFSKGGEWICCTSDSNIVHVFASKQCQQLKEKRYLSTVEKVCTNPKSWFYILRKIFPYFDAEYSYCSYDMPDFESQMISIAGFGFHDDALMIINDYGSFKRVELELKRGRCKQLLQVSELMQLKKMMN